MRYLVREYPADGHTPPPGPGVECSTIAEARAVCCRHLGLSRLPAGRRWVPGYGGGYGAGLDGDAPYSPEAYHDYPASHPHADGCGGIAIIEVTE